MEGYVNIDIDPRCEPDIVTDLSKGIPFEDGSVDEIFSDNFVEHIEDFESFFKEMHRVLKPKGIVKTFVPYQTQPASILYNHCHRFNYCYIYYYFTLHQSEFELMDIKFNFLEKYKTGVVKVFLWFYFLIPRIIASKSPSTYEWFLKYRYPASKLEFTLRKNEASE